MKAAKYHNAENMSKELAGYWQYVKASNQINKYSFSSPLTSGKLVCAVQILFSGRKI